MILTECWRKRRERNGYASEKVERLRAKEDE
jgi:hypothetical protein